MKQIKTPLLTTTITIIGNPRINILHSRSRKFACLLYCLLLLITFSCRNSKPEIRHEKENSETTLSCNSLLTQYQSYDEAKSAVTRASFKLQDAVNTSKSSWIRGASYYSCDGRIGYFLLATDQKDYLFQGMPLEIWQGFKGAESFGEYYNAYIRGRYYMYLRQR